MLTSGMLQTGAMTAGRVQRAALDERPTLYPASNLPTRRLSEPPTTGNIYHQIASTLHQLHHLRQRRLARGEPMLPGLPDGTLEELLTVLGTAQGTPCVQYQLGYVEEVPHLARGLVSGGTQGWNMRSQELASSQLALTHQSLARFVARGRRGAAPGGHFSSSYVSVDHKQVSGCPGEYSDEVHSTASTESWPTGRRPQRDAVCRSARSGCESAGEGSNGGESEGSGQKTARKRRSVEMSGGEDDNAVSSVSSDKGVDRAGRGGKQKRQGEKGPLCATLTSWGSFWGRE